MRKLRATGLALAILATVIATDGSSASANHFYQAAHTVQFNIWGYKTGVGYNANIAADVVASVNSRNPKPLSISLNEVCSDQFDTIVFYLASMGYSWMHTYSRGGPSGVSAPNGTTCKWFGNAVLWLGGNGNSLHFGYFANPGGSQERRNWACALAVFPAYWSCTTHLQSNNDTVARLQANEYRDAVDAIRVPGSAVIAAGDFNLDGRTNGTTNALVIAAWYGSYFESDNVSNSRTSSRPTIDSGCCKFDYIFRANPASIAHGAYMFNAANSDHFWVQMYL